MPLSPWACNHSAAAAAGVRIFFLLCWDAERSQFVGQCDPRLGGGLCYKQMGDSLRSHPRSGLARPVNDVIGAVEHPIHVKKNATESLARRHGSLLVTRRTVQLREFHSSLDNGGQRGTLVKTEQPGFSGRLDGTLKFLVRQAAVDLRVFRTADFPLRTILGHNINVCIFAEFARYPAHDLACAADVARHHQMVQQQAALLCRPHRRPAIRPAGASP